MLALELGDLCDLVAGEDGPVSRSLCSLTVADLVPVYPNLIVTRTFSKAFSLAGLRIGYAIAPTPVVDWLNRSNDAYPLARPAQAAALACLAHLDEIRERTVLLKGWARAFADELARLGVQVFPTETYFFLGKVPGMTGDAFAAELSRRQVLVKSLHQPGLGEGFVRFTTSTPEHNAVALVDQSLRRKVAKPVRRAGYQYSCHFFNNFDSLTV